MIGSIVVPRKKAQLNKIDDTMSKIQLKFGDIMPPLLTAQAHVEPGSRAALSVEAALEQCGRAFVHVTRQRRLNASNLTDPNKEYLLKRNDVFATGPEARDWLFTSRFLDAMLKESVNSDIAKV